jgi:hypothetical protein
MSASEFADERERKKGLVTAFLRKALLAQSVAYVYRSNASDVDKTTASDYLCFCSAVFSSGNVVDVSKSKEDFSTIVGSRTLLENAELSRIADSFFDSMDASWDFEIARSSNVGPRLGDGGDDDGDDKKRKRTEKKTGGNDEMVVDTGRKTATRDRKRRKFEVADLLEIVPAEMWECIAIRLPNVSDLINFAFASKALMPAILNAIAAYFPEMITGFAPLMEAMAGRVTATRINASFSDTVTDAGLIDFSKPSSLDITGCRRVNGTCFEDVDFCASIRTLSLGMSPIEDKHFTNLANLVELDVVDCLSIPGLRSVEIARGWDSNRNYAPEEGNVVPPLYSFSKLRKVAISCYVPYNGGGKKFDDSDVGIGFQWGNTRPFDSALSVLYPARVIKGNVISVIGYEGVFSSPSLREIRCHNVLGVPRAVIAQQPAFANGLTKLKLTYDNSLPFTHHWINIAAFPNLEVLEASSGVRFVWTPKTKEERSGGKAAAAKNDDDDDSEDLTKAERLRKFRFEVGEDVEKDGEDGSGAVRYFKNLCNIVNARMPVLKSLGIFLDGVDGCSLSYLDEKTLSNLSSLVLREVAADDDIPDAFGALTNLESLEMKRCNRMHLYLEGFLKTAIKLERFYYENKTRNGGANEIDSKWFVPVKDTLKRLRLSCHFTDDSAADGNGHLRELINLESLELFIYGTVWSNLTRSWDSMIRNFPSLKNLVLSNRYLFSRSTTPFGESSSSDWTPSPVWANLERFRADGSGEITNAFLGNMVSLKTLELLDCQYVTYAAVSNMPFLEILRFNFDKRTMGRSWSTEGVGDVLSLCECKNLKKLYSKFDEIFSRIASVLRYPPVEETKAIYEIRIAKLKTLRNSLPRLNGKSVLILKSALKILENRISALRDPDDESSSGDSNVPQRYVRKKKGDKWPYNVEKRAVLATNSSNRAENELGELEKMMNYETERVATARKAALTGETSTG